MERTDDASNGYGLEKTRLVLTGDGTEGGALRRGPFSHGRMAGKVRREEDGGMMALLRMRLVRMGDERKGKDRGKPL